MDKLIFLLASIITVINGASVMTLTTDTFPYIAAKENLILVLFTSSKGDVASTVVEPKFKKVAEDLSHSNYSSIKLATVNGDEEVGLVSSLEIKTLPSIYLIQPKVPPTFYNGSLTDEHEILEFLLDNIKSSGAFLAPIFPEWVFPIDRNFRLAIRTAYFKSGNHFNITDENGKTVLESHPHNMLIRRYTIHDAEGTILARLSERFFHIHRFYEINFESKPDIVISCAARILTRQITVHLGRTRSDPLIYRITGDISRSMEDPLKGTIYRSQFYIMDANDRTVATIGSESSIFYRNAWLLHVVPGSDALMMNILTLLIEAMHDSHWYTVLAKALASGNSKKSSSSSSSKH